jgi:hypothetical protein
VNANSTCAALGALMAYSLAPAEDAFLASTIKAMASNASSHAGAGPSSSSSAGAAPSMTLWLGLSDLRLRNSFVWEDRSRWVAWAARTALLQVHMPRAILQAASSGEVYS